MRAHTLSGSSSSSTPPDLKTSTRWGLHGSKATTMATSVVPISILLGPSSSGLILEESIKGLDERCSSAGIAGFRNKQRPVAALGRSRAAHPSSSATFGLVLSCSRSGYSCRGGFVGVSATKQKQHRTPILDLEVDDNFEVDDDDDDDENDEATEFADMEEWNKNKPAGFGVKEYDTSLEDRLLAEIEADKKAAAEAVSAAKKKDRKPLKTIAKQDAPPQGVEVFVGNLPRKRNVDRDLRAAFRSSRGLLHIRPIVDGNEKTREPMCKGLAFLTFSSDNDAKDFIQRYNGLEVKFGKMEKKLVCELAALNSPFKKEVSRKRGTDSPRLQIRDINPSSSSPLASSSSRVDVDLEETRELSATAESKSSDKSSIMRSEDLEGDDEDIDSLDVSEADLLELEQEVWAGLEDEDDFELDRELEGDSKEDLNALLHEEKARDLEAQNDKAQNREDLVPLDIHIHASDAIHVRKSVQDIRVEDEDQEADIQHAESSRGRGFGLTPDNAAVDKDRRIQELESKLKELQVQIEKRKTKTKTSQSEEKIEALEKRLLARARSASEKNSKISTAKKGTGSQKPSSKVKSISKRNPSRPKLGSASRLKNKAKHIYTGILSKYSSSAKEVAL